MEELKKIDYKSDIENFESYIKILKLDFENLNIKKIVFVCTDTEEKIKFCFKDEIKKLFSDEKLNSYFFKKYLELNSLDKKSKKLLVELNYIYIFSIIEHIAGMTDSFAREEYKALYLRDYE
jgi:dGTP triphosphohydrolase